MLMEGAGDQVVFVRAKVVLMQDGGY